MLGSTVSSLIAASPQTSSALSLSLQSSGVISPTPLSPAAIKISRDSRLLEHLMPKVGQHERMLLLNWFLEEERLKQYEVFKREFFEDPDEYNYALSSILGTFMWDVTPANPNSGTISTFVGPNSVRRNSLYPYQLALTEKWRVLGTVFSHSWNNALDKTQREALIMRSFIDTANINKDMTDARRQSFDLRTSELSGRGFIPFIQEHLLQNTTTGTGHGTPVSLPHTENMVRVFKDWVEKSGSAIEDDSNDTLFRRSCALSLRDKCIYSRALFATRLCITVLEMWEQIIRTVEVKRRRTSKSNDAAIECPPVTTVTEVEVPAKQTKHKKKKKAKSAKRARRTLADTEVEAKLTTENSRIELQTDVHGDTLEFSFEDEFAAASGTDESKSSGVSSPTGTGSERSKFSSSTKVELTNGQRDAQGHVSEEIGHAIFVDPADPNGGIHEHQKESSETLYGKHEDNDQSKIVIDSQVFNPQEVVSASNPIALGPPVVAVPSSTEFESSFPMWEEFPDQPEAEWLPVKGKKRKVQVAESHHTGPNNRNTGRKSVTEGHQPDASLNAQGNNKYPHNPAQIQLQPPAIAIPQFQPTTMARPRPTSMTRLHAQSTRRLANAQLPKAVITNQQSSPKQQSSPTQPSTLIEKVQEAIERLKKPINKLPDIEAEVPVEGSPSNGGFDSPQVGANNAHITSPLEAAGSTHDSILIVAPAAESESTNIVASSTAPAKGKKHKQQRKRTKSISKEQFTEHDLSHPVESTVPPSESLNLENVTFFCVVCHRPRGYHHSVQCPMCGPGSTIRYCSLSCQMQDTEHWRLCGLSPFPVPVLVPGSTAASRPIIQNTAWMTPAFARQRMLLVNHPNIDYFLFSPSANSPKHKLVFHDKMKPQFTKLRQKLFQQQGVKAVTLLYRVIKSHCQDMGINLTPQDLASQLFSEFGVNPLLASASKDLRITHQDWIAAGVSA
ncbi:hypothetical protein EV426DRAFT_700739 [Tirmania nivea]|nr:hypothetical protein EV426DRAFT_700739 [Tirmania nivea]